MSHFHFGSFDVITVFFFPFLTAARKGQPGESTESNLVINLERHMRHHACLFLLLFFWGVGGSLWVPTVRAWAPRCAQMFFVFRERFLLFLLYVCFKVAPLESFNSHPTANNNNNKNGGLGYEYSKRSYDNRNLIRKILRIYH